MQLLDRCAQDECVREQDAQEEGGQRVDWMGALWAIFTVVIIILICLPVCIQKLRDYVVMIYNFACCFVRV